ncbi:MAG: hypothetical protein AB1521_08450 [Bacteroidota bacterium]
MKLTTKALLIILFLMTFLSCKKNSLSVEPEPNYEPGKRDYVWTADTIKAYYIYISSIWGKTVDNVWAVSMVGGTYENIYRYNGTNWYKETRTPIGNTTSLWGTDDNLWISTHDGHIWNYSNNTFTSSPQFLYGQKEIYFFNVVGKNNNEVYACGGKNIPFNRDGLIYKYDGVNWHLELEINDYGSLYWARYSSNNDKYYFLAFLDNKELMDTTRLLEYDGENIKVVYQNYISDNTSVIINDINGYLYVTIGHKIFRYYRNNFEQILEINNSNFGGQTWGRNKNDIFIRMFDGLMHYNGSDTQYILKFPENIDFGTSTLVLEKDVFVHAFDNKTGYNIIYHGQLR